MVDGKQAKVTKTTRCNSKKDKEDYCFFFPCSLVVWTMYQGPEINDPSNLTNLQWPNFPSFAMFIVRGI